MSKTRNPRWAALIMEASADAKMDVTLKPPQFHKFSMQMWEKALQGILRIVAIAARSLTAKSGGW